MCLHSYNLSRLSIEKFSFRFLIELKTSKKQYEYIIEEVCPNCQLSGPLLSFSKTMKGTVIHMTRNLCYLTWEVLLTHSLLSDAGTSNSNNYAHVTFRWNISHSTFRITFPWQERFSKTLYDKRRKTKRCRKAFKW